MEDNPFRKVDVKPSVKTTLSFSRVKYINNDDDQPDTIVQGKSIMHAFEIICLCLL